MRLFVGMEDQKLFLVVCATLKVFHKVKQQRSLEPGHVLAGLAPGDQLEVASVYGWAANTPRFLAAKSAIQEALAQFSRFRPLFESVAEQLEAERVTRPPGSVDVLLLARVVRALIESHTEYTRARVQALLEGWGLVSGIGSTSCASPASSPEPDHAEQVTP